MGKEFFSVHWLVVAVMLFCCRFCLADGNQIDYCHDIAAKVLDDPTLVDSNVVNIVNEPSCFFQASLKNPAANMAITPARVSLWNAFQSLSGSQQQGSNLSSSGSTNSVSKPSGPTALVEEFGGANVSSGTSSTTLQWSPGTMFTNLALTGVDYQCLTENKPEHCISAGLLRNLTPLTLKITGNTSGGSPSMNGTATSSTSNASAQPVKVNSTGNSGPSFAGLTVQYAVLGSREKSEVSSLAAAPGQKGTTSSTTYYVNELKSAWESNHDLSTCDVYSSWQTTARAKIAQTIGNSPIRIPKQKSSDVQPIQEEIEHQYQTLLTAMLASQSCQSALNGFKAFYAAILEADTYEYFGAMQSSSAAKPEVALEYDLNTPLGKPSYSAAKVTGTWNFHLRKGKGAPPAPSPTQQATNPKRTPAQESVQTYAQTEADVLASVSSQKSAPTLKQVSAPAKSLAQADTPPWSFTLTGTADIYNAQPPSSVPSASHLRDIQAGAEIARVFSPSKDSSGVRNFIGSITAALAYSYEDQTSPALLTGPALSDFTGLPSSTTAAYAQRGIIHLGQLRLGFGTGTNLTFPVAFTYSNRTELIVHPTWRLEFGITYNLTSLFSSSGIANSPSSPSKQ